MLHKKCEYLLNKGNCVKIKNTHIFGTTRCIGIMLNKNKISNYHIKCPCCNAGTINSQYDICLVCGWEDDIVQNEYGNFSGGANKMSLIEHRQNFLEQRKKNPNYNWGNNCR